MSRSTQRPLQRVSGVGRIGSDPRPGMCSWLARGVGNCLGWRVPLERYQRAALFPRWSCARYTSIRARTGPASRTISCMPQSERKTLTCSCSRSISGRSGSTPGTVSRRAATAKSTQGLGSKSSSGSAVRVRPPSSDNLHGQRSRTGSNAPTPSALHRCVSGCGVRCRRRLW